MTIQLCYTGKSLLPSDSRLTGSQGPICWRPSVGRLLMRGHLVNNPATFIELKLGPTLTPVGSWYDISNGIVATKMEPKTWVTGLDCTEDDWCFLGTQNWYNTTGATKPTLLLRDFKTGQVGGPWLTPFNSNANGGHITVASNEMATDHGVRWLSGNYVAQGSAATNWGPSLYTLPQPGVTLDPFSVLPAEYILVHPATSPLYGWHQTCHIYSMHDLSFCTIWVGRETYDAILPNGYKWYGEAITSLSIPDPDNPQQNITAVYKDIGQPPAKGWKAGMRQTLNQPIASAYHACLWVLPHGKDSTHLRKIRLSEIMHPGAVISGAVNRAADQLMILDSGKCVHHYSLTQEV